MQIDSSFKFYSPFYIDFKSLSWFWDPQLGHELKFKNSVLEEYFTLSPLS